MSRNRKLQRQERERLGGLAPEVRPLVETEFATAKDVEAQSLLDELAPADDVPLTDEERDAMIRPDRSLEVGELDWAKLEQLEVEAERCEARQQETLSEAVRQEWERTEAERLVEVKRLASLPQPVEVPSPQQVVDQATVARLGEPVVFLRSKDDTNVQATLEQAPFIRDRLAQQYPGQRWLVLVERELLDGLGAGRWTYDPAATKLLTAQWIRSGLAAAWPDGTLLLFARVRPEG